jgi:hypothetical protein
MLAFHSHCQLGNQMFIYACAHSLAKKTNQSYCLSELGDLNYFELSKEDYRLNSLKWLAFRIKNIFKKFSFQHLQDNRIDYSSTLLNEKHKDVWYYGYFQGEQYFYDNDDNIKSRFKVKSQFIEEFKKVRDLNCGDMPYTIVHIRLKDYKTFGPDYLDGPDLSLPFSYYHHLIRSEEIKGSKIVFLSDDIDSIKSEFSYVENAYFSDNNMIIDLQFIMNAKTCVLSCSTFSWWGAWLNETPNKLIYIPAYFLGFKVKKEYPVNIIPEKWIQVPVNL